MCSDRKAGNCDRQKKNEAKQPGDVSSLLGFALIYIQSSTPFHTGPSFKKQHICPDFEVMDELSSAMHGNESCYFLLTPCIHQVLEITNHMVPRNYIIVNMNSLILSLKFILCCWRDSLVVKSACCSCRVQVSAPMLGGSSHPIIPAPGGPVPYSGLYVHLYTYGRHT